QTERLEGVPAHLLDNCGHDAPPPMRPRQPVADLGPVGLADLEAVEAAAADQGVVGGANRPMNRTALLSGAFGDLGEPFVSGGIGVGEGDAQRALVDVPVVEMCNEGVLVRRAELG